MFGRKFIFYCFASCILMEMVEVSVETARRQLGFCEAKHITKELWAVSLASWKLVLALTFDLSSLGNIMDVLTGYTSSAAVGAGTSRGAVAGKCAVGTGSQSEKALSLGPEMLSKPECRPKEVWPKGPTYWALPKGWESHVASVSKA